MTITIPMWLIWAGIALLIVVLLGGLFVAALLDIRTALLNLDFLMDPLDSDRVEGANL